MSDVTVKRFDEMERYQGEFQKGQTFLFAGKSLGVEGFGMNVVFMPPEWEYYPEHNHARDRETEVYVVLEGDGVLRAGDESWNIAPGMAVRVGPDVKRRIVPGKHGMTLLAIGHKPANR